MVQLSIIALSLTSALPTLVAAGCKEGGIYCGVGLKKEGNYITQINTGLKAAGEGATDYNENQSLWSCEGSGAIVFKQLCLAGCVGNGKNDDSCLENDAAEAAADAKRNVGLSWTA
ncbi:hypothetical protein LCER1_G003553 [Lachnellula cervina]|uniref:Uncharacterized protein n=1 Tax=Lachnellula cervina TaxID=1316786 RepID=A0A7D8YZQ4_9HELO|nr:hypothetical protein LCER1_G003553 [Lachnellula cervina]